MSNEVIENEIKAGIAESDEAALAGLKAPETPPPAKEPESTTEKEVPAKAPEPTEKIEEPPKKPEDAITPRPHARQETKGDFDALKTIISSEREKREAAERQAKEFEEKLSTLEKEFKTKAITPEMEAELKELREERRAFNIENDPEFKQKYSEKLKAIDERALGIMAASGMQPDLQKFIQANGGVMAMYNSNRPMPEGNQYAGKTHQEFIEEVIMPRLPAIQKTRLEQAIGSGMDLRDEMSREIEHAKTHGSELQQKKAVELEEIFTRSAIATRQTFGKKAEKWDVLPNDSKDEKARKEKHNARVDKAEALFKDYMASGSKNPAKVAEALARASYSQYLMEEAEEKDAEIASKDQTIKDLEERLEKIKGSGAHGSKENAPHSTTATPPSGKPLTDAQALEQAFGKK